MSIVSIFVQFKIIKYRLFYHLSIFVLFGYQCTGTLANNEIQVLFYTKQSKQCISKTNNSDINH